MITVTAVLDRKVLLHHYWDLIRFLSKEVPEMRKLTFQDVHDCQVIQEHGDMVIFLGKHPWIFRKDGTFIARLKGICRSWNMLLLPDNRVFFDGYGDRSYHYVSLTDGEMLWSIPKKGKRNFISLMIPGSILWQETANLYGGYRNPVEMRSLCLVKE